MPIEFKCHNCGQLYRVKDEAGGKTATCKKCGSAVQVPFPTLLHQEEEASQMQPSPGPTERQAREGPVAPVDEVPDPEMRPVKRPSLLGGLVIFYSLGAIAGILIGILFIAKILRVAHAVGGPLKSSEKAFVARMVFLYGAPVIVTSAILLCALIAVGRGRRWGQITVTALLAVGTIGGFLPLPAELRHLGIQFGLPIVAASGLNAIFIVVLWSRATRDFVRYRRQSRS